MIGDDPYTLGLFDTAGKSSLSSPYATTSAHHATELTNCVLSSRTGRLRPTPTSIVPSDRRFPRLLQRHIPRLIRERQGEMVP